MESTLTEPPSYAFAPMLSIINPQLNAADTLSLIIYAAVLILLIICSATISSSENAFFSLTPWQIEELTEESSKTADAIHYLTGHPKKLLATILIANTFVNIAFVLVSTLTINTVFDFSENKLAGFFIEVVFITFLIVLLGEVMPKIYASQNNQRVAALLARPMVLLNKLLTPFVTVLVRSTSVLDKRMTRKGHVLSVDELTHAIEITAESNTPKEEKTILKSIVNFGNINVKQIMRQRPDISAIDQRLNFTEVLGKIKEWEYSRVPVFDGNLDKITGILYVKDLLPHTDKGENYNWSMLVRKPYFVPESKKIDDLLKEFQSKRVHMAIVIDEYGGTSGIATMEDILEEIFGEIQDEFDEDEVVYSRIDDSTYVFEAKILINDMCRYMEVDTDRFEQVRNDADTLGGLLLEINGDLPLPGEEINFEEFRFIVESVDKRRIKRVKVIYLKNE